MIVATRPEPTVRPPSRYLNSVFCGIFFAFFLKELKEIGFDIDMNKAF